MNPINTVLDAPSTITRKQALAAIDLSQAIRELGEVPSGHLYAASCGALTLDDYRASLGILKRAGLVTEADHVLRWVGPKT